MNNALDDRIDEYRRMVRRYESEGNTGQAEIAAARLTGLVEARTLAGGADLACLHPVHKAAYITEDGKQRWRCVDCGVVE